MSQRKTMIAVLEEIALLLELKGENPFKIRTYANAARVLQNLDEDPAVLVTEGRLGDLKGFGKALVSKLTELVTTGELIYLNDLRAEFPDTLRELMRIPGLGPKKVQLFYKELDVQSIDQLEAACSDGRVAELPGCGAKTAAKLLEAIKRHRERAGFFLYCNAKAAADHVVELLKDTPGLTRIEVAGSLRRYKEVTKDADILASGADPEDLMDRFVAIPRVASVIGRGETKASVVLDDGMQVDLRLVADDEFPYALHHFTGSRDHNIIMRQRAQSRGLKLSEWGLFDADENRIPCTSEQDIFTKLGLNYIPPQLREAMGEVEHAETSPCPALVQVNDYKGSLHNHTTASDGNDSIEDLVAHARSLGHEYIAVTDHSKASFQANGLDEERIEKQLNMIDSIRPSLPDGFHVLSGIECDIKPDGTLDIADDLLAELDQVIVSVHGSFTKSEKEQTERVIRALEHPSSRILSHPTGRLLLRRDAYAIDLNKVIDAAAANGVAIELNCHPMRLDMSWNLWRKARDKGVLCSVNPDAHWLSDFGHIEAGIGFAGKGWLTADDIINCWDYDRLMRFLKP